MVLKIQLWLDMMSPKLWVLAVLWVWQIKYLFYSNSYTKLEDFCSKNSSEISEVLWNEKTVSHPSFFPPFS